MKNIKGISLKKVRIIFYCLCLLGTLIILLGAYISQLVLVVLGGGGVIWSSHFFAVFLQMSMLWRLPRWWNSRRVLSSLWLSVGILAVIVKK